MVEKQILNWAVGAVIKNMREKSGLTQVELADFTGLSETYVSKLERGDINASVFALARIAEVLKESPAEIMKSIEAEIKKGPVKPRPDIGRPRKDKIL